MTSTLIVGHITFILRPLHLSYFLYLISHLYTSPMNFLCSYDKREGIAYFDNQTSRCLITGRHSLFLNFLAASHNSTVASTKLGKNGKEQIK